MDWLIFHKLTQAANMLSLTRYAGDEVNDRYLNDTLV